MLGKFFILIAFMLPFLFWNGSIFINLYSAERNGRKIYIAIYHFNVKIVSRGKGASAVAKAA